MRSQILNKWQQFKNEIEINDWTPIDLYLKVYRWSHFLKEDRNIASNKMYDLYIRYFECIDVLDYRYSEVWFNIDNVIKYDLLNPKQNDIESIASSCKDVLWELVAFKSNIECIVCEIENYRVLTDQNRGNVFLVCDNCLHAQHIANIEVDVPDILFPVTPDIINKYHIVPNQWRGRE